MANKWIANTAELQYLVTRYRNALRATNPIITEETLIAWEKEQLNDKRKYDALIYFRSEQAQSLHDVADGYSEKSATTMMELRYLVSRYRGALLATNPMLTEAVLIPWENEQLDNKRRTDNLMCGRSKYEFEDGE